MVRRWQFGVIVLVAGVVSYFGIILVIGILSFVADLVDSLK